MTCHLLISSCAFFGYVKFVFCNLKVSHRRHICIYWSANNIWWRICRYVHYMFPSCNGILLITIIQININFMRPLCWCFTYKSAAHFSKIFT